MTQENKQEEELTEAARQNLERIAELRQNQSPYIKLQPSVGKHKDEYQTKS
jgi:hypothetical protein